MSDELEQLELNLANLKGVMKKRDNLLRLSKSSDFKEIFIDGFIKGEAIRLTALIGEEGVDQDGVQDDLRCISAFQRYMRRIEREGDMAEKDIPDYEAAIDEVRTASNSDSED